MNKHLFKHELNGTKLSATLSTLSTVIFVLGVILAGLIFLIYFIAGIVLAVDTNSAGGFISMLFNGILGGILVFFVDYVISVLLKALAAITLHTYITAVNSENVAESIAHKKDES